MTDIADINRNLEIELKKLDSKARGALYSAGLKVESEAFRRTPKHTGHLRDSYYTEPIKSGVEVGNTADYALYVHEDMEAHHPIGQAKFLESALNDKRQEILRILKQELKIK